MNNQSRRPAALLYPDFGMALWDSPERNVRLVHRFSYEMLFNSVRFRELVGTLYHDGRIFTVRVRTDQPLADVLALIRKTHGQLWLRGRVDRNVEVSDADDTYQPLTGSIFDTEPEN